MLRASLVNARQALVLPFLCPRLFTHPRLKYSTADYLTANLNEANQQQPVRVPDNNADLFKSLLGQTAKALDGKDVNMTIRCWAALKERDLHRHLSPTHLARISQLIMDDALPKPGEHLERPKMAFFEEIALMAAISRSPAFLEACMSLYLAAKDTTAIIALNDRFIAMLGDEVEAVPDAGTEPVLDFEFLGVRTHSDSAPYTAFRVNILLTVITAHALRDDFGSAVNATVNGIRLHDYTVKAFLAGIHDQALNQKLQAWLPRLEVARLLSSHVSYSIHLRGLGNSRAYNTLVSQYNTIIDGILGPDPFIAAAESKVNAKRVVFMSERIWTAFLSAFLVGGYKERASQLWIDLGRCGLQHTTPMWTALIDSFAQLRQCENAYQTFLRMQKENAEPDVITYRALISALLQDKRFELAQRYFTEFQTQIEPTAEPAKSLAVYNTYLHGLLSKGKANIANELFEALITSARAGYPGAKPDLVTFNTFIGHYGREGDLKGISRMLKTMAEFDVSADVITYSSMLSALLQTGTPDAIPKVFQLMSKQGLEANIVTYGTMIVELMKGRTPMSLRAAVKVLERMEMKGGGTAAQAQVYEAFLVEYWRWPFLPMDRGAVITQDIMSRLKKRGIQLTSGLYHAIIGAALQDDYPQGVEVAWKLYQHMQNRNLAMSPKILQTLLDGMVRQQQLGYALKLCADIDTAGYKQTPSIMGLFKRVEALKRRRRNIPSY